MVRTIDDLGIETYTRYAQDKSQLDEKIIQESHFIPFGAEMDVTFPSFSSEFDLLLETNKRNPSWADFFAPPLYFEQKKRLFSFQIIPSLGSDEKKESQLLRIKEKAEQDEEEQKKRPPTSWEEERDAEDKKKEKNILLKLINRVNALEKDLIDINSRRNQYQKG
ncbi:MAG: DUF5399 family protein [Chlamydiota bacterium]